MLSVRKEMIIVNHKSSLIKILNIDGVEGITLKEASEMLGVGQSNIKNILTRVNSRLVTLSTETRTPLLQQGLGAATGRMPIFISQDQIEILVRVINTPEANAIYRQLWKIARDKEVAIRHHTELAGETDPSKVFTPDLLQRVLDAWKSEIALKEAAQVKVIELTDAKPLTADQYKATKDLVDKALRNAGYFPAIQLRKHPYAYLMAKFEVPAVAQIPAKRFDEIEVLLSDFKMLPRYHKLYKRYEL